MIGLMPQLYNNHELELIIVVLEPTREPFKSDLSITDV